jgi:hypothetical protein
MLMPQSSSMMRRTKPSRLTLKSVAGMAEPSALSAIARLVWSNRLTRHVLKFGASQAPADTADLSFAILILLVVAAILAARLGPFADGDGWRWWLPIGIRNAVHRIHPGTSPSNDVDDKDRRADHDRFGRLSF